MSDIPTKVFTNKCLGVDCDVLVPADVDALVSASSKEDVWNAVVLHSFYQNWNVRVRRAVAAELEKTNERKQIVQGGVALTRKTRSGEDVPVLEDDGKFVGRIKDDTDDATWTVLVNRIASTVDFQVKKAEEESKPAKDFYIAAKEILGKAELGSPASYGGTVSEESWVANWTTLNPGRDFYALGGWTEDGIARAVQINRKRVQAQADAGLV